MDAIRELFTINFSYVLISVFVILVGIKAVVSLFEWIIGWLGLETKFMRQKREEYELLIQTSQNLAVLQNEHKEDVKRSDQRDDEISAEIKHLTNLFVEREIEDMRWDIINFATDLSSGSKKYNRESFDHIFRMYQKYESILEERHMKNGLVTESMSYINEMYHEKLENGEVR